MCQTMTANPPAPPVTALGSHNTIFIIDPWFDPSYVKTVPGIIKVAVIVLDLLAFICVQSSAFWSNGRGVFFNIVAHLGLWFSVTMLVCYLYHIVEKYHKIKWLKIEMIGYGVMTFLWLIAATVAVAFGNNGYSAGGFFGYVAMVLYGFDAFLKAKAWKSGEVAQGRQVITQQQHITTPPSMP